MPPRRKKNGADYRWALPGGDEVSALSVGYSRMQTTRAIQRGRGIKTLANERLLMAKNQWYLGDRFGILIPTDEKTVTTAYRDDLQAAQSRHHEGLEKLAADIHGSRPKNRVMADGSSGQLGRIYKHLSNRTSRAPMAAANWQDEIGRAHV